MPVEDAIVEFDDQLAVRLLALEVAGAAFRMRGNGRRHREKETCRSERFHEGHGRNLLTFGLQSKRDLIPSQLWRNGRPGKKAPDADQVTPA